MTLPRNKAMHPMFYSSCHWRVFLAGPTYRRRLQRSSHSAKICKTHNFKSSNAVPSSWWPQQKYLALPTYGPKNYDHQTFRHKSLPSAILICNHSLLSKPLLFKLNSVHDIFSPCSKYNLFGLSNQPFTRSYNHLCDISLPDTTWLVLRSIHTSRKVLKDESKVEKTVKALKEQTPLATIKGKSNTSKSTIHVSSTAVKKEVEKPVKKSVRQRVIDELKHYYHGFRLLFIDIRVCVRLMWQVLNGKTLNRRERRQLVRTTADMFRLVPFLVFIIVPFMEFLLPVVVKLFPNMLPSTFAEENKEQEKIKKKLKMKLEMAKFLQDTLEESAVQKKKHDDNQKSVQDFAHFLQKIRTTGETTSTEEIIKYSKLFEDEITLDNLRYDQLAALCRLLDITTLGSKNFLGFQLRVKLRQLEADDRMIQKEGIDSLNVWELQEACRARGMRALGLSKDRLRVQLQQWLDLHLNASIPTSLLLLSRALYLPESLSTEDQLKATISSLPESTTTEAKVKISEVTGERVDNKAKLDLIRQEEEAIKEQQKEEEEEEKRKAEEKKKIKAAEDEKKKAWEVAQKELLDSPEQLDAELAKKEAKAAEEELVDTAPILDQPPQVTGEKAEKFEEAISPEDIKDVETAIEAIVEEKTIRLEEQELKEAHEEYKEDLADLKAAVIQTGGTEADLTESKAAKRLAKKVNKMIAQADSVIMDLSAQEVALREDIEVKEVNIKKSNDLQEDTRQDVLELISEKKRHLIDIEELVFALRRIQKVPDETKMNRIAEVIQALDIDEDGAIDLEDSLKVLELLGQENIKISSLQMKEIASLLRTETELHEEEKLREKEEKQCTSRVKCQQETLKN